MLFYQNVKFKIFKLESNGVKKNMQDNIFKRIKTSKFVFIFFLLITLFFIRDFNNTLIYNHKNLNFYPPILITNLNKSQNVEFDFDYEGFVFFKDSKEKYERQCKLSKSKIFVHIFYDLFYPNRFRIWNYNEHSFQFQTTWFNVEIKKGFTEIDVTSNQKVFLTYNNKYKSTISSDYNDFVFEYFNPMAIHFEGEVKINKEIERQRYYELNERGKMLSLYFYISLILLITLSKKGYKINLACFYFFIMGFFYGDLFVTNGVLFNISFPSFSSSLIIKNIIFFLILYCIKTIYVGFKNIKHLKFKEICIIIFFILLPFVFYL